MGDKLIKQTPGNGRQLFETWDAIEMLLETGYAFEKQYVVAALRNATPEVDNLLQLMRTPEVMAFLQERRELKEKVSPAVEQFLNAGAAKRVAGPQWESKPRLYQQSRIRETDGGAPRCRANARPVDCRDRLELRSNS
jgi:hypothetical protein